MRETNWAWGGDSKNYLLITMPFTLTINVSHAPSTSTMLSERHEKVVTLMAKSKTVVERGFVIRIENSYFQTMRSPSLNTIIAEFMLSTTTQIRSITKSLSLHLS